MDINYELYKVFYYVGKTLSFSDASKQLYISQSAVSQSIKVLEKKLNKVLFDRSTKKVKLTEDGELLFKHVETAINLITRGENQILENDKSSSGQIRIAASEEIIKHYLVPIIDAFHKEYSDIHIKLISMESSNCKDILDANHADLVIVSSPYGNLTGYRIEDIKEYKDVFVVNRHMLDICEGQVRMEELLQYPMLTMNSENDSNKYLHSLFLKHSLDLVPDMELSNYDLLLKLAKAGLGIAFVPEFCLNEDEELSVIETYENIPKRNIIAAYDEECINHKEVKDFLRMLKSRRFGMVLV